MVHQKISKPYMGQVELLSYSKLTNQLLVCSLTLFFVEEYVFLSSTSNTATVLHEWWNITGV